VRCLQNLAKVFYCCCWEGAFMLSERAPKYLMWPWYSLD
jgi:hypothetical protein